MFEVETVAEKERVLPFGEVEEEIEVLVKELGGKTGMMICRK